MDINKFERQYSRSLLAELCKHGNFKNKLANIQSESVNQSLALAGISTQPLLQNTAAEKMKVDGVVKLGCLLNKKQIDDIHSHFKHCKVYPSHVASISEQANNTLEEVKKISRFAAYGLTDILNAPHILNLINSPAVVNIARNYLGCQPTLYSVNSWWSFEGKEKFRPAAGQKFHRDPDGVKFCSMFIFLTDTDEKNGAHKFIKGSHNSEVFQQEILARGKQAGLSKSEIDQIFQDTFTNDGYSSDLENTLLPLFADKVETLSGDKGSAFITDSYGLHKGLLINKGERLILWARYSITPPASYYFDKTQPVSISSPEPAHSDPIFAYTNRLLIK